MSNQKALSAIILFAAFFSSNVYSSIFYDKNGNQDVLNLSTPVYNDNLDAQISYQVNFTTNNQSGKFEIRSEQGRDMQNDFVLSVTVKVDQVSNFARLVFYNNGSSTPKSPELYLFDCGSGACESIRRWNKDYGSWQISDVNDIIYFPIEFLDARVLEQLLDQSQLSTLTGNHGDIMSYHRRNFGNSIFRLDLREHDAWERGEFSNRIRGQINNNILTEHNTIAHHSVDFLLRHREMIKDMELSISNNFPQNSYALPFGRMPMWDIDMGAFHQDYSTAAMGTFTVTDEDDETVTFTINSSNRYAGTTCFHQYPEPLEVPRVQPTDNISSGMNISQFPSCNGVPCYSQVVQPLGYAMNDIIEGDGPGGASDWHDHIHGIIGGMFNSESSTAAFPLFWAMHTSISEMALANWLHAQRINIPVPTSSKIESSAWLIPILYLILNT